MDDYSLLSFSPLDITNGESVGRILAKIDHCHGYRTDGRIPHRDRTSVQQDLFQCAVQQDAHTNMYESLADVRERMASPESIRELRRKK